MSIVVILLVFFHCHFRTVALYSDVSCPFLNLFFYQSNSNTFIIVHQPPIIFFWRVFIEICWKGVWGASNLCKQFCSNSALWNTRKHLIQSTFYFLFQIEMTIRQTYWCVNCSVIARHGKQGKRVMVFDMLSLIFDKFLLTWIPQLKHWAIPNRESICTYCI